MIVIAVFHGIPQNPGGFLTKQFKKVFYHESSEPVEDPDRAIQKKNEQRMNSITVMRSFEVFDNRHNIFIFNGPFDITVSIFFV